MTNLSNPRSRQIRSKFTVLAFLLSTALTGSAFAVSMPDLSPEQIAQDSERSYNSTLGRSEVVAPSFDPFEADGAMAGTASLRSAGSSVTRDGRSVSGGAFLDLAMIYTTDNSDPYDTRGIERGVFLSGQPVDVIRYDHRTLDCSENVREVVYDDSYYSGARYGYIGGIYRLFPRYRGHRNFGHSYGHGRSYWGGNRRGRGDDWRRGRGDDDDVRRRRDDDDDVRRRRDDDDDVRRRRDDDDDVRRRRRDDDNDVRRRRPERDEVLRRDDRDRKSDRRTVYRPRPDIARTGGPDMRTPSPSSRPARPSVSRPAPRPVSRPAPEPVSRPAPKPASRPAPSPRPAKIDRAVDRHFSRKNPSNPRSKGGRKHMDFYPMQFGSYRPRTDVYVSARCAREETLSVHIPQDRLDAARFDGFTLLLLDRQDREIPVFIPPNYVEGFRQAARNVSYSAPVDPVQPYPGPPQYSAPAPAPYVTVPRSSREPIIYGDPSGITGSSPSAPSGYPQE